MADDFTREYSHRLGVLTGDQLQSALTRFELGELVGATPAPGGLFGQNVFLTTTSGEHVLRGAPHYDGQFEKERYFCRLIHERSDARAPWPFVIDKSTEIFGWSYALMPLLPGIHLSDREVRQSLTPEDRIGIARAMGAHLALLQKATWPSPADYSHALDDLVSVTSSFAEWFVARTNHWLALCRKASAETTDADVGWIESIIAAAKEPLAEPFAPVLVHTDYAEGNVVAENEDDGWKICGVFDLGDAFIGDGEYDLARLACSYDRQGEATLRAFCGTYAAARPPRAGCAERLALYILADRLIFWEFGQRNSIWFTPGTSFRTWAEPFVEIAHRAATF